MKLSPLLLMMTLCLMTTESVVISQPATNETSTALPQLLLTAKELTNALTSANRQLARIEQGVHQGSNQLEVIAKQTKKSPVSDVLQSLLSSFLYDLLTKQNTVTSWVARIGAALALTYQIIRFYWLVRKVREDKKPSRFTAWVLRFASVPIGVFFLLLTLLSFWALFAPLLTSKPTAAPLPADVEKRLVSLSLVVSNAQSDIATRLAEMDKHARVANAPTNVPPSVSLEFENVHAELNKLESQLAMYQRQISQMESKMPGGWGIALKTLILLALVTAGVVVAVVRSQKK